MYNATSGFRNHFKIQLWSNYKFVNYVFLLSIWFQHLLEKPLSWTNVGPSWAPWVCTVAPLLVAPSSPTHNRHLCRLRPWIRDGPWVIMRLSLDPLDPGIPQHQTLEFVSLSVPWSTFSHFPHRPHASLTVPIGPLILLSQKHPRGESSK